MTRLTSRIEALERQTTPVVQLKEIVILTERLGPEKLAAQTAEHERAGRFVIILCSPKLDAHGRALPESQ